MSDEPQDVLKPEIIGSEPVPGPLPVAGFWIRAGALAIDVAILYFAFSFVAKYGYELLYPYRWACQLGGFVITFLYFVIGSSSITGGQTFGKKLMHIRVISTREMTLLPSQSLIRGALVNLIVFAFVFYRGSIHLAQPTAFFLTAMAFFGALSIIYSTSTSLFCGLHPKKQAVHDLLAGTAVARDDNQFDAREFLREWDDYTRAKLRLAVWPAALMALFITVLFAKMLVAQLSETLNTQIRPMEDINRALSIPGFTVAYFMGPSEKQYNNYLDVKDKRATAYAEATKKGDTLAAEKSKPWTDKDLEFAPTGLKFHFFIEANEMLTTPTLLSDPRYEEVNKQLPGLAETLLPKFFDKAPYTGIQVEWVETLPLYLYSSSRLVWHELIPVTGHEPPPRKPKVTNERQQGKSANSSTGSSAGTLPTATVTTSATTGTTSTATAGTTGTVGNLKSQISNLKSEIGSGSTTATQPTR